MKKKYKVVAAIIIHNGSILCVQRPKNKFSYISEKFEFPGGKVESGESFKDALKREIDEELSIHIDVKDQFLTVEHEYPDFEIDMQCYLCSSLSKDVVLNEHIDFKWLGKDQLRDLDWAEADIPVVEKLMRE